jgi:hypothetical protein
MPSGAKPQLSEFELQLLGHLADLNTTLEVIGIELEALVTIQRCACRFRHRYDPLKHTNYDSEGDEE